MSNIPAALDAVRALVAALGPRLPEPGSPARCVLDFGHVDPTAYAQVKDAMRPLVFEFDRVNDVGETEMDATGYIGGVSLRVRTARPATVEELEQRIDRMRSAQQARAAEAVIATAMADLAERGL